MYIDLTWPLRGMLQKDMAIDCSICIVSVIQVIRYLHAPFWFFVCTVLYFILFFDNDAVWINLRTLP